jgi:catechol 2,3-dioxygenase-like lactoylglutathione lyase family enzyme
MTTPDDDGPRPTLTAIVPCNDLDRSEAFYRRLGFERDDGDDDPDSEYRMLTDAQGAAVHLTDAVEGWVVPGRNPFGLYLYTPDVDARAAVMRDDVIEPGRTPEHKEWGMYEFSLSDPDGVLVRVGWPSRLVPGSAPHRP